MAEPDETHNTEPAPPPPAHAWDTWEELLLASAVHRHGTTSWDSVAAEIQKRSSAAASLTPLNCRQKYLDLKRRFGKSGPGTVPWLDELRSLRVQELRREVERCDLSIVSLQLKVKNLKEERDTNCRERPDPGRDLVKSERTGEETGEPVTGEDDRSVNESNSTENDNKKPKPELEPVCVEPVGDDSCNGSSDSVNRKPVIELENEPVKVEPDRFELKENSDVLSSAMRGESDKGQSTAVKKGLYISQPLVEVLEMVRSHRLVSAFERRFMIQEIGDKKNPIRQHIDIETIHTRLEEGCYSDCNNKFFRDLLLLFNNATILFNKNTPEFKAAIELRKLISLEICSKRNKKLDLSKLTEPDQSNAFVLKPKISVPIVVCRKRSSISGKASATTSGGERKELQEAGLLEDRPLLDWKQAVKSDDTENTKTRTSERFVSGSKNSKKNQNKVSETQAKGKSTIGNKIKLKSSTLLESLKDSDISPKNSKGGEGKRERRARQVKEQPSPVKRNNGRVAKKAPSPAAVSGKRSREGGDADVVASGQPKKRTRR